MRQGVCETELPKVTGKGRPRLICKKAKCRNAWAAGEGVGKYADSASGYPVFKNPENISENAANAGGFERVKAGPGWRIVAGPALTPSQMHCATVPDGPDCQWTDGSYERLEAQNRRCLKAHFAKAGEKAAIQLQHMPLNIQGGYQPKYRVLKLNDGTDAEQWKLPDLVIPGMGYDRQAMPEPELRQMKKLPDDLSIPDFLLRRSEPLAMAA